ncbi:Mitochondrial 2-oxodicarboxylate carrier [Toxocara canis]|uniref:Mitochondrial 2-oxodicarboxylate carrier n=1 Tax=Toxocara canis TaxID=6265 RepID=A0A0B2UTM6_TOXCA|nr:Mitochondrial 2-oxodicarboxylate carrier [Toxocara canis]
MRAKCKINLRVDVALDKQFLVLVCFTPDFSAMDNLLSDAGAVVLRACKQIYSFIASHCVRLSAMVGSHRSKRIVQLTSANQLPRPQLPLTRACVNAIIPIQKALFNPGILPPLIVETPKTAVKFFTFEQYNTTFKSPHLDPAIQRSIAAIARDIIRTEGIGINWLYFGLTATLARHGTWNMIYFGLYYNMKPWIPDAREPTKNLVARIGLGFIAGTIASVANIPCDVAKSRIQGPRPSTGVRKYKGLMQSMILVYKQEGRRDNAGHIREPVRLAQAVHLIEITKASPNCRFHNQRP